MQEKVEGKVNSERQEFLDILRILATCAVVLMHTVTGTMTIADFTGYERRYRIYQAIVDLTAWSVPVFLMISGYLFLNPWKDISWQKMLCKYCRRILFALLLFGVPYSLLELVAVEKSFQWKMVPQAIWNTARGQSWAHMWYLYVILILYAITPVMRWIMKKVPAIAVYGFAGLLLAICSVLPFLEKCLGDFGVPGFTEKGIYLFYYLCGYFFVIRKQEGKRMFGLLLFMGISALEVYLRLSSVFTMETAYSYPLTAIQAIALFAGIFDYKVAGDKGKATIGNLGKLCFGIYLIHPVFLNVFYKFLGITLMNFQGFVGLVLFWSMALVGAALVTIVLRKIKVLREFVL